MAKRKTKKRKTRRKQKGWWQKIKNYLTTEKNRKKLTFFSTLIVLFTYLFWGIPLPTRLGSEQLPVSTKIFDRNGKLIYEIYADKRTTPIKLDELPDYVSQTTISIEDKDFYKHYGISFSGITRALYAIVFKHRLQGGSTLTQQLVKNSLLTPERTIRRKIRELALTLVVETLYTKEQILQMYLNQTPYGGTAYGIGAASELYFGKEAKDLTLGQAALLAGLVAAPSRYSPFGSHPELAKERQRDVLRRMLEDGYITVDQMDEAEKENLDFAEPEKLLAPHFVLMVKEQLAENYGEAVVEKGGLRVRTTLDLDLQNFAEQAVATEVAKLKSSHVGNGAALITRPKTGEILAMVGSKDYFAKDEDGKVNIIFAKRQPGSSIKPLNYSLAIQDKKITPSTPLADVPTCFDVVGQAPYCPRNYDGTFHGATQVRFTLGNSYNVPAVRVLALNGIENFIDFAKKVGITTFTDPANYGLSLTLGGGEVRPYDMAVAFGTLANEGVKQDLVAITKVSNWKGKVLEDIDLENKEGEREISQDVAYIISHILLDNNARVAAFGDHSYLVVNRHPEVSVKTGTTNDLRDNWTIGYTKGILALTWVGNNDNTPMSRAVSGVSGASPIWNKIIKAALDKAENGNYDKAEKDKHAWPLKPDGVVGATVCTTTGDAPEGPEDNPGCPTRFEYFLKDNIGAHIQTGNTDIQIDKTTGALSNPDTPPENVETQNHPFLVDPLGTLVCLNCPIASSSATIRYPLDLTAPSPIQP